MGGGASKQPVQSDQSSLAGSVTSSQPSGHVINRKVSTHSIIAPMNRMMMQYSPNDLPPARPPKLMKKDIFSAERYVWEVDKHVVDAPLSLLLGGFPELAWYLTRSHYHWDAMCKVRAIFLWVATVDVFGLGTDGEPAATSPLAYLLKIKANTGNHANLIDCLCRLSDIPCIVIDGMNKSAAYEVGGPCDRKKMAAQWNAVYVNGDWRFLDAFWASACLVGRKSGEWTLVDADGKVSQKNEEASEGKAEHRLNEFFFIPDPDKLIWTHFPDRPEWQLLENTISVKDFEQHVYLREKFYELGMKLLPESYDKVFLESVDGEIDLVFSLDEDNSALLRFMYLLYLGNKQKTEEISNVPLHRFVLFEHTANRLRFSLRFPVEGTFKMDILGGSTKAQDASCDITCSYIITCKEPKKSCLPLPDAPTIGWGPVTETKEAGLKPITHDGAIIVTKDGNVEIRLRAEKDIQLHQMLRHALIDDATLSDYAVTRLENGEAVLNIRLPQGGEYALKLYADNAGTEGLAPNVLNYLIKAEGKNINNAPFPNISGGALSKKPAADKLGIEALSHKGGMIHVNNGRERIEFSSPDDVMLMAELHTSDQRACKRMLVKPSQKGGKWAFHLDLPEKGEYSLNVFACDKKNKDSIYNVHSYIVQSDGWEMEDEEETEGETQENKPAALKHVPTETVQTSENEVLIPIPADFEDVCASLQRRNANDSPDGNQVSIVEQDGMRLFRATLPEFGEYQLNLYDRDGKGVVRNIAKYQINRRTAGELYEDNTKMMMQDLGAEQTLVVEEKSTLSDGVQGDITNDIDSDQDEVKDDSEEEEKRRAIRRHIRKAIDLKDPELLRHHIAAYEKLGAAGDDKTLDKARKTLAMLEAKEDLIRACQQRDLGALKKAITRAQEANYDHRIDLQLAVAYRLRDRLERLAKLQHTVLNLDSKTVAEIRTYSNPPSGVHQSMMATFILLGNTPKEVKNWKTCQALMGKTGRESLMRRISQFDPQECSMSAARLAKQTTSDYTMAQIRDVSAGAATFFGWSLGMIDEVESTGGSGPSLPNKRK